MSRTKIEWTEMSWNPVVGCTKVSAGCQNCYAEKMAVRLAAMGHHKYKYAADKNGWTGSIECCELCLGQPLHWRKPRRIFVCSMGDLFHKDVPFEFIDKVAMTIALAPQHTYQILTKRPKRALACHNRWLNKNDTNNLFQKNLWLGVSVENQKAADERIPILLQIPAAVRFVSAEPMLSGIWFNPIHFHYKGGIHWVIIGCESINGKVGRLLLPEHINNPMSGVKISAEKLWMEAARDILSQCKAADVPPFVKQIPINGKVVHDINKFPKDLQIRQMPRRNKDER